ncbi:MAG: response regulator, partial [Treponema sp.]|nr:response regulator [Treponema sp.]
MDSEKILIIEDDLEIQEMLKYAFEREGWKLIQLTTGEEGLEYLHENLCKKHIVDCIILDIMLPGMDGLKALKKIRNNDDLKGLPIIITSAKGEEAD